MDANDLKNFIQSANINFLIGSGLSMPYLTTLGDIEKNLESLSTRVDLSPKERDLIKASIFREYFKKVMLPNLDISDRGKYGVVLNNYKDFICVWNSIMHNRCGNLRSKQLNVFSTNIDMFFERAADSSGVEFVDGFQGSVTQIFSETNFQKIVMRNSLHFHNVTELPVFNLLKIHGSVNWRVEKGMVVNDSKLEQVATIATLLDDLELMYSFVTYDDLLDNMANEAKEIVADVDYDHKGVEDFIEKYNELVIVNPTKKKFSETVIDDHFYELMRMYSNALERENTLLFVMGFSFADEHILNITQRALKTNPTLLVVIYAYDEVAYSSYKKMFGEIPNVRILSNILYAADDKSKVHPITGKYDFKTIIEQHKEIRNLIPLTFDHVK
ncbi:MAG: hypothetical protein E7066_09970 [Lentimicrobiaceae bacterium]|nr:hypothetical protein [Lentimicrobiaceae bacterium]